MEDEPQDVAEERPPAPDPLVRAVRTYLDHLSVERGLAANTLVSYRRDLRRYLDHLAGRDFCDDRRRQLQNPTHSILRSLSVIIESGLTVA